MSKKYQLSVQVEPHYIAEQSEPARGIYVFAYHVTIVNTGTVTAQLISRTWHIVDATGHKQHVKGLGVIGHQPLLPPGEKFEYASAAELRAPTGTMHGSYFCVAEDGERFEIDIPMFLLDASHSLGSERTLH